MDEKVKIVLNKFSQGLNCSQAIFSSFAPNFNVPERQALKIAAPFGGGMGHMGEVCGAVSGALMIIGLKFGSSDPSDKAAKENCYRRAEEFANRFKAHHGTILCRRLLELDISDPNNLKIARQEGIFKNNCPNFVQTSTEILLAMLNEDIN